MSVGNRLPKYLHKSGFDELVQLGKLLLAEGEHVF